ncbi:MAG: hypothetical protein SFY68_13445 [Candidatus Sumerlaeia bacterium]|nr:hypothetical protein [Candidatus Sumerlaeia bacterium]
MISNPITALAANSLFSILDWGVIVILLTLMIGIGVWAARGQSGNRDYFLGGRNLPWWAVGCSIIATETSALSVIGIPALAIGGILVSPQPEGSPQLYTYILQGGNMFFMMLVVGYVTGRLAVIKWIIPKYFTGEIYTTYELINHAFGERSRIAVATLSVVQILLGAGVRIYVTAIPIALLLVSLGVPGGGIPLSILVILIGSLLFTTFGGIKSVVYTDLAQYLIFVIAAIITAIYIPYLIGSNEGGGVTKGIAVIAEYAHNGGPWKIWNSGFSPVPNANLGEHLKNILAGPENFIAGLIPMTFGILLAFGFDQQNVQRVLACKSVREGQKAMLFSAVMIVPQFFLFLLIGVELFGYYNWNGFDYKGLPPVDPAWFAGSDTGLPPAKSDYIFPVFIFTEMPPVLKGFLLAAIITAASVSSAISALASMAVADFYLPWRGKKISTPREELMISRVAVLLAGIALGVVALVCSLNSKDLITLAFTLTNIPGGPILGAFLFAFYKVKGDWRPLVIGITLGFLFMALMSFYLIPYKVIWPIHWSWHAFIGGMCTFSAAWLADLFFRKFPTN